MEYFAPRKLSEVLVLIKKWKGKSKLIGGGTNVILEMRAKAIRPYALVDISQLKNLSYIKEEKEKIRVGGFTSISELASSKAIQNCVPILAYAANQLGNPLVRNRATIGNMGFF